MSEQIIRNKLNKEIGYIKTDSRGKQIAYNKRREIIGCFDPKTNLTKDANNRVIGNGNMLMNLILSAV